MSSSCQRRLVQSSFRTLPRHKVQRTTQRTFLTNPLNPKIQTLTATRTVPYPASAIYAVVSDISSYSEFIPLCQSSTVTRKSGPDKTYNKLWPEEAELSIGYNDEISEKFSSRVYCDPERCVEAVSGSAQTTLDPECVRHHSKRSTEEGHVGSNNNVLTHLVTRWSLRPFHFKPPPQHGSPVEAMTDLPAVDQTEVSLYIEYRFASPVYAALTAAAAPKLAEYMIEAFENRVKSIVDGRPAVGGSADSARQGVIRPRNESP